MLEPSGLYYPNRIARYFLLAMEDVIGKNGLTALLSLAELDSLNAAPPPDDLARHFDFSHLAALSQALEEMYGARGGQGMALRIGRACFANGMKSFGVMKGMADPAFRALPLETRTDIGVRALAAVFTNFSDQSTQVLDAGTHFEISTEFSPYAWGRSAERPVCNALVGVIQEGMRWASDGYEYHVHETQCRALGDDQCVFRVNKTPIGQL